MLNIDTLALDFELLDQAGTGHKLSDYRGQWVLLYFYPKDDTPGCTAEACAIRDTWADFKKAGIVVLGISHDKVDSHAKFVNKYQLPFTLLADTDKLVITAYQAKAGFLTRRISYLINPEGKIAKVYSKVNPSEHAGEILKDYKELNK